ncbi:hypothetical protein AWV80_24760 [Cupriavidus sp. UYMU48A]|nr:hypothetical protein AWV80_24760 [Cupriavidus sp. UYMU48A]
MKAYFALKMSGDDPQAPHMARARAAILAMGGAEASLLRTSRCRTSKARLPGLRLERQWQ